MEKIIKIPNGFILPSGLSGEQWQKIKHSKRFTDFRKSGNRIFKVNISDDKKDIEKQKFNNFFKFLEKSKLNFNLNN